MRHSFLFHNTFIQAQIPWRTNNFRMRACYAQKLVGRAARKSLQLMYIIGQDPLGRERWCPTSSTPPSSLSCSTIIPQPTEYLGVWKSVVIILRKQVCFELTSSGIGLVLRWVEIRSPNNPISISLLVLSFCPLNQFIIRHGSYWQRFLEKS